MRSTFLSLALGVATLASCAPPPTCPASLHSTPTLPDSGGIYPSRCSEPWPLGVREQVWPPDHINPCTAGGRIGWPVEPPELESKVDPAQQAGCSGTVVFEALIGRDGRVKSAQIVRGVGEPCDGALLVTLPQWRFRPARWNGPPVSTPDCSMRRCDPALVYLTLAHTFRPGPAPPTPGH